jgi:hypothetical protein
MTDKKIAEAIGIHPANYSSGYRNSTRCEKRYQYLIQKIGASIAAGETEFVPHAAVINTTKIAELCSKLEISDMLDDDGFVRSSK